VRHYTTVLIPDTQEGGYTATVPALPGLITEGDSDGETVANAKDAIALYIADIEAAGENVPVEHVPPTVAAVAV